jgi:hypothetical protein
MRRVKRGMEVKIVMERGRRGTMGIIRKGRRAMSKP